MNLSLRPATELDLPRILEIYNHAVLHSTATFDTEPKSLEDRRQWLLKRGENYPVVVALDGKEVIGWGSLSPWSDRLGYRITAEPSLYVDEKARGKGAGREIMRTLVAEGRRLGFHSLISRIADANETSVRLHSRFGFRCVGKLVEVGVKFGRKLDVVLYQLILGNPGD